MQNKRGGPAFFSKPAVFLDEKSRSRLGLGAGARVRARSRLLSSKQPSLLCFCVREGTEQTIVEERGLQSVKGKVALTSIGPAPAQRTSSLSNAFYASTHRDSRASASVLAVGLSWAVSRLHGFALARGGDLALMSLRLSAFEAEVHGILHGRVLWIAVEIGPADRGCRRRPGDCIVFAQGHPRKANRLLWGSLLGCD